MKRSQKLLQINPINNLIWLDTIYCFSHQYSTQTICVTGVLDFFKSYMGNWRKRTNRTNCNDEKKM